MVVAWAGYSALAQALGAEFKTTLTGTVFEKQTFGEIFDISAAGPPTSIDPLGFNAALTQEALAGRAAAVIGRQDFAARPLKVFPALEEAEMLDIYADGDRILPESLAHYDVIYVDSVLPNYALTMALAPLETPLRLKPELFLKARAASGGNDYVAIHARHGNGEHLHNRIEGTDPDFAAFLDHIAKAARRAAQGKPIICVSDNAQTARTLAERTGGTDFGAEGLPNAPHLSWFKAGKNGRAVGHARMMSDLACLAGAKHIIAGYSQFAFAGHILGDGGTLEIVSRDGSSYSVQNAEIGFLPERAK